MSLLDDVIAERGQFISIKDILLNISFNNNEPLYDVAYYLSVMYDSIEGLDIYHFDEFNFFKDEQVSNHFELLLYKVLDSITIGSGRDWAYSGNYSSFGDYWGDGEGLLKTLNSYPYSYLKKADINNNGILSRLVNFDTKTPIQLLADAQAKIADLEIQAEQVTLNNDKPLYTTPAIEIMNEVIKEFWINYDPNQPAPKQITITNWITDKFKDISPALALNIDKVCRHSSARSGGKYKR